jgi:tetratricopeptide (TPR) repeat protein/tRNA A-37 threonylcarbamoyl transferase component Bud32
VSEVRVPSRAALDAVDELVFEYLERVESGERIAVDDYCRSKGEHERALRERLVALEHAGLVGAGAPDAQFPERLGDFRLLERIGGGGMGVVYLAEQTSLGRRVALKLIRPDQLYFPGAKERFRREVEAAARLAHPGIVPVYTFGEESGLPYFAMEHVDGVSLARVLEAFAGRAPESLTARDLALAIGADLAGAPASGSWIHASLSLVRQTADALQHAHERGVLHRDVKPSNVILTRGGEPKLVDFGLATRAGADRLTRTGAQVGSVPYMPPELAGGDSSRATAASDVYSLGVTLYEMLTLRLPYAGESTAATLALIAEGRAEPPRRINPSVSIDAETVCLAAMDPEPQRRYASAAAFAADLARVLELKPIAARRASTALRLRRWVQRNPARAAAAALSIVVAVGGPLGYGAVQSGARKRIETANAELARANAGLERANAEVERKNEQLAAALAASRESERRAERNLARARDAVERMLTRVGDRTLANVPRMERVRGELLQDALALQREFLEESRGDPSLRAEVGEAELRCARVLSDLGRTAEAEASFRAAMEAFDAVPGDPQAVERSAFAARALAVLLNDGGRRSDALALLDQSLARIEPLANAPDGDAAVRTLRAQLVATRGELERLEGRMDDALASWRAALAHFDTAIAAGGDIESLGACREGRARTLISLGRALLVAGEVREAEPILADAERAWGEISAAEPDSVAWQSELAAARVELANAKMSLGRFADATPHLLAALETRERLAADFPHTAAYRAQLAGVLASLGNVASQAGRTEEALAKLRRARDLFAAVVAEQPDSTQHELALAQTDANIGATLLAGGDLEGAALAFDAALRGFDACLGRAPDDPRLLEGRVVIGLNLALLEVQRGAHAAAVAALPDLARWPGGREHLGAAWVYAGASELARADSALTEAERTELAERHARSAVAALEASVERGYGVRADVEGDDTFAPLRQRADFQAVLRRMR